MGSDAIANPRISAFARDSAKKKKGSRFGKVKQNKVDVRREQWVSQVKNKGCKIDSDAHPTTVPKPMDDGGREFEPLNKKTGLGPTHYCSSGHNFALRTSTATPRRRTSSSSSSFSSSSEEGDRDYGCLHNWDAMSDALPSSNTPNKQQPPLSEPDIGPPFKGHFRNPRAWAPDDTSRPRTLPRVTATGKYKRNAQMYNNNRKNSSNSSSDSFRSSSTRFAWQRTAVVVVSEEPETSPSACPICCEEFDKTDSSFLPCACGFRLCLFCHKRILEVDARCPGCRKQYDSVHPGAGFECGPVVGVGLSGSVNHKRG